MLESCFPRQVFREAPMGIRAGACLRSLAVWTVVAMACATFAAAQVRLPIQVPHRYPASRLPTPFAAFTLTYYGGPVMSNVQVVAVFWTANVNATEQSNAPGFYSTVTNSPWMDVMQQQAPGSLLLVGAGVIGKIYCNWWKDRGGVAMGSFRSRRGVMEG